MSRIGAQPIPIPAGIRVEIGDGAVTVTGPKGTLTRTVVPEIGLAVDDGIVIVSPRITSRKTSALWGLTRALVANMVRGVSSGFEKKLEFEGIGYRAAMEGTTLVMQLGFSHPVKIIPPDGIALKVDRNVITVSGADNEAVGIMAAAIRAKKKPEPYKGKGIRYQGEIIRRKAGKKGATTA
jgi:large subunit ribosomal protein L6